MFPSDGSPRKKIYPEKFVRVPTPPEEYVDNLLVGSTRLRFVPATPVIFHSLGVDDPTSYRMGIGSFVELLARDHRYGREMPFKIYQRLNDYYGKILDILTIHPTFDDQMLPSCFTLISFKVLGLLEEIDVEPLVSFIKFYQQPDGGFRPKLENHSYVEHSFWAVCALASVGEQPRNVTGLKDFLYGLQSPENYNPVYNGFFKPHYPREENESVSPDGLATLHACHILKVLGYPIPNREILYNNTQTRFNTFLSSFSIEDYQKLYPEVSTYFIDSISFAFAINAIDILQQLKPYCWQIHDTLLDETIKDKNEDADFSSSMAKCGNTGHKLQCYLTPKKFTPDKNGSQQFSLTIFNPSPYNYSFSLKELSAENSSIKIQTNFPNGFLKIGFNESLEYPTTISIPTSSKLPKGNLSLKLSMDLEIAGLVYGEDSFSTSGASSEVFFELPVKKNLSPAALSALIVVPTITAGSSTATGILIHRKKKKKTSEN